MKNDEIIVPADAKTITAELAVQIKVIAPPAGFEVGEDHLGIVDGEFASSMTNEEVEEMFGEMLKGGAIVVIARKEAANGFVDVYLAQLRDIERAKRLNGVGGPRGLSQAEVMLKNFGGPVVLRHRDVFDSESVATWLPGCKIEGLTIGIYDAIEASDDVHEENPRQSTEGLIYTTAEGDPIFRHTSVDFAAAYEGDFVLDYVVTKQSREQYKVALAARRATADAEITA